MPKTDLRFEPRLFGISIQGEVPKAVLREIRLARRRMNSRRLRDLKFGAVTRQVALKDFANAK